MKQWVITKREHKTIKDGVLTVVTEEQQEKKVFSLDNILKVVGAVSIIIPLILLYVQNRHEHEEKINVNLSQVLVNVSLQIETVRNSESDSPAAISALDSLLYKYPAKIAIFKDDDLDESYHAIAKTCSVMKVLAGIKSNMEPLALAVVHIDDSLSTLSKPVQKSKAVEKPLFTTLAVPNAGEIKKLQGLRANYTMFLVVHVGYLGELKKIAINFPKDTVFLKVFQYLSDAQSESFSALYYEDCLESFIQNKGVQSLYDFYYRRFINGATRMKTIHMSYGHFNDGLRLMPQLNEVLERNRDRFQSLVISHIKK